MHTLNLFETRPLKKIIFASLCGGMGEEHEALLLQWSSRGEVLPVCELQEELEEL